MKKRIGYIIAGGVAFFLLIWGMQAVKTMDWAAPSSSDEEVRAKPLPRGREILADGYPSERIPLISGTGVRYNLEPTIKSGEVGYVILWDCGDRILPEPIPARNKRPKGWTSGNPALGKAFAARFQLEPGSPPTKIAYTLTPQ